MNGVHKNPQTVQLAGAEPLRAEALQKFRAEVAPLLASLSRPDAKSQSRRRCASSAAGCRRRACSAARSRLD